MFAGADVDFIIGGEVARIPDFRPRLREITVPVMVLAGRYDRALHPRLQGQFTESDPRIRLEFIERSGSFSHVEEPDAVVAGREVRRVRFPGEARLAGQRGHPARAHLAAVVLLALVLGCASSWAPMPRSTPRLRTGCTQGGFGWAGWLRR